MIPPFIGIHGKTAQLNCSGKVTLTASVIAHMTKSFFSPTGKWGRGYYQSLPLQFPLLNQSNCVVYRSKHRFSGTQYGLISI